MNVVKCENGHFFDADVYAKCPHCRETEKTEPGEKKRVGFFGRRGKKKTEVSQTTEDALVPAEKDICPPTELILPRTGEVVSSVAEPQPEKRESPLPMTEFLRKSAERATAAAAEKTAPQGTTAPAGTGAAVGTAAVADTVAPAAVADTVAPAVNHARSDSLVPEQTVGCFCTSPEDPAPCVGWLVGLYGPYRGQSLELKPGGNTVGRGPKNRIDLSLDNRVSRDTHAYLVYEPRERKYYMEAGKSTGLSYVNGEVILHQAVLSGGEVVEIGGGKYLFVPLCSDKFSWEAYPQFQPICREGT